MAVLGAKSRLAIMATLFSFQSILFMYELLILNVRSALSVIDMSMWVSIGKVTFSFSSNQESRRRNWFLQLTTPIFIGLIGLILVPVVFTSRNNGHTKIPGLSSECVSEVDADVGGDGIRIAIWAQECISLLVALFGTFHSEATGAKEIGAGIAITHVSLIIALLVQMSRKTLSSADAIIGAMIIDSQSNAISIQFVAKETLAARWQVIAILLCQLFGLVTLPLIVQGFVMGRFERGSCECVSVFWWAWLNDCSASSGREMVIFWVYYALRCMLFMQSYFHSINSASIFHMAEKHGHSLEGISYPRLPGWRSRGGQRDRPETGAREVNVEDASPQTEDQVQLQQPQGPPREHDQTKTPIEPGRELQTDPRTETQQQPQGPVHDYIRFIAPGTVDPQPPREDEEKEEELNYPNYPATVTLMYTVYAVFALSSMAAAEKALRESHLEPSSGVVSTGQIIALVVAGTTIVRGGYLFFKMFSSVKRFRWPFSLGLVRLLFSGRDAERRTRLFMLAPKDSGHFIKVDEFPVQLGGILENTRDINQPLTPRGDLGHQMIYKQTQRDFVYKSSGWSSSDQSFVDYSLASERVETVWFIPRPEFILDSCKDPNVQKALRWGPVYMVTGIRVGENGMELRDVRGEQGIGMSFSMDNIQFSQSFEVSWSRNRIKGDNFDGPVVLMYRLVEIRRRWWFWGAVTPKGRYIPKHGIE